MLKPDEKTVEEVETHIAKEDMEKIFIRAKIGNKWGSYSLNELYDRGEGEAIKHWLVEKALSVIGVKEGMEVKKFHIERAIKALEEMGVIIYRINKKLIKDAEESIEG